MQMQPINVDKKYHFFNPRVGISYSFAERNNLFASFAIAQKEPTRSDFTDRYMFADDQTQPKSEMLFDYEVGYQYASPRLRLDVNLYYMRYRDQLIPTGMVNDSSDALNVNVPKSYRCGVELSAAWDVARWLTLGGNATLSRNKIIDYVDMLADSPTYKENLGTMTIAYSPDVMAAAYADFHFKGFEAVWRTQYVGKQYFTNNECEALSLNDYCVTNLELAYTVRTRKAQSVRLGVTIYNLLNSLYCSNGYGYSYMWDEKRYDEAYYFPQAPLHALANITVKF
jgi:iron complex outermembrane receptor protein